MTRLFPRSVRRAPAYSAAIVGMLTIGTALLVTIFSQLDATLFRPPPFTGVDRLVMLYNERSTPRVTGVRARWPFRRTQLLRQLISDLGTVATYSPSVLTVSDGGVAEGVPGEVASHDYFDVLRAAPILGRTFLAEEDSIPGAHPVVMLGHGLWLNRFGGDSGIVGRAIRVNGQSLTVTGVLPPGFRGLSGTAQLWIPVAMAPLLTYPEYLTTRQYFISVVARLRVGVTLAQAESRLNSIGPEIASEAPDPEAEPGEMVRPTAISLNEARVGETTRRSLLLLLAGAGLLHLLACANVANLMLGRSVARRREAAILMALGGSRRRRLAHFAAEGLVLAVTGGLLGVAIAWLVAPLIHLPPDAWGPRIMYGSLSTFTEPGFGPRSLGFGVMLTVLTAGVVAWVPAITLLNPQVTTFLRDGAGASRPAGTLRRPSVRGGIVAAETAAAMLLLVTGGLLVDSFLRMRRTDLGIDADRVLMFRVRPSEARVPPDSAPAFIARFLAAITALPGVEAATVDGGAPVSGSARSTLIIASRPPADPDDAPPILRHYVAPDHFKVLGVPLLRGRVFTEGDIAGRPRVAVISQSAARRFWPDRDPIGQRIWFGGGSSFIGPETSAEIVGVVGDVVYEPLDAGTNRADFYTPYQQFSYAARTVLVRTRGDPLAIVPAIRQAVARVDPDLPLVEVQSLRDRIGDSWARQRFEATLFGGFAGLALVLAALGVYSVVSFAVGQRTRELGIRLALGAQPSAILRMVVSEGLVFPLIGLVAGGAGSFAAAQLVRGSLYQISPGDPRVPLATLVVLLLVAVLACYFPARRATQVDPAHTLRAE
jgi:putative ABC transport system permease protein